MMEDPISAFIDPSQIYRPEKNFRKADKTFREFSIDENDHIKERVRETYLAMHTYQTVEFVRGKIDYWSRFDKAEMTIMEALDELNNLVDESDPDVDVPNIVHAFQTAERIREDFPTEEWLQLTGLVHDLGKVMAIFGEKQWAVVGDTFPVGCAIAPSVVYRDTSFHNNPDLLHPVYSDHFGMYEKQCGLDQLTMSWGHDEYLYRVLSNHKSCRLPQEALYIIRFHSFYPWHSERDYAHLTNAKDEKMLFWLQTFNKYDLYTKSDNLPDMEALTPYYQNLIDKYIPGLVKW